MDMTRNGVEKKTRIFYACEQPGDGSPLLAALTKTPELNVEKYFGDPDDIFVRAVAKSADLAILLFPDIKKDHERCVNRILRGTFSHILLITGGELPAEIAADTSRITVWRYKTIESGIDGAVARIVTLGLHYRRFAHTTVPAAKESASAAHAQTPVSDVTKLLHQINTSLSSKIVAVGASTGGTEAIFKMLSGLKPNIPGIVVVQHMPPVFTEMFAQRLDRELPFEVCEAKDNQPVKPGTIHVAPGDRHLMIKKVGGAYYTVLGDSKKVSGHCPAVNVLFSSVARAAGAAATGVILTGMGSDGAEGMLEMRNRGAWTIGQDEQSSVVYGMPKRAYEMGGVTKQAPLDEIAGMIMAHFGTV